MHDAILLRVIAFDRAVHSMVFGLLAIALTVVDTKLFDLQSFARNAAAPTCPGVRSEIDSTIDYLDAPERAVQAGHWALLGGSVFA